MRFVYRKTTPQPGKKLAPVQPPAAEPSVKRWDSHLDLNAPGVKSFTEVKDGDAVIDYRDVTIKGYLSTFQGTTAADRDGDAVESGAFAETLKKFAKNPVMLRDHRNSVDNVAGSFRVVKEDAKGLYVEGVLSNSPAPADVAARFKVAEGHLRTLSMGGIFYYREGGRSIFKVELWEGSLTPIPANPDAIFSTRSLTEAEMKQVKSNGYLGTPNQAE